jgi:hypothetical protein
MKPSLEVLGIEAAPGEQVLAIVPSRRVSSENFFALLKNNNVPARPIGVGSGRVIDADGRRVLVSGILVVAIPINEAKKTQNLARLCGITAVTPEK